MRFIVWLVKILIEQDIVKLDYLLTVIFKKDIETYFINSYIYYSCIKISLDQISSREGLWRTVLVAEFPLQQHIQLSSAQGGRVQKEKPSPLKHGVSSYKLPSDSSCFN